MGTLKKEWVVAGLMSGTSLDGLDIAVCRFFKKANKWEYEILSADTIAYSSAFKEKLNELMEASSLEFAKADAAFGRFSGKEVKKYILKKGLKVDLVASHGHTIFHQPGQGYTTQIGNGAYIYAESEIPVVSDFRSVDVGFKGQGAPLVPIGDALLFGAYTFCMNLGGIANISFDLKGKRIAGDICPVNILMNKYALEKGKPFDKSGRMAAKGKVHEGLLRKLNSLSFYKSNFPKSMGREWIDKTVFPLIEGYGLSVEDKLATVCEHIAIQIGNVVAASGKKGSILITGGGAFNDFLVSRIQVSVGTKINVVVPSKDIVSFKESLIFAFLGLKRVLGETNVLKSVTGATRDTIGGALYGKI